MRSAPNQDIVGFRLRPATRPDQSLSFSLSTLQGGKDFLGSQADAAFGQLSATQSDDRICENMVACRLSND